MATLGELSGALCACLNPLHPGPCKGWKGHPEEMFTKSLKHAAEGDKALKQAYGSDEVTLSIGRRHIEAFQRTGLGLPGALRRGEELDPDQRDALLHISIAMEQSHLKKDTVTYRGVANPSQIFGTAWKNNGDNTGLEWTDKSFVSTSASPEMARLHATDPNKGLHDKAMNFLRKLEGKTPDATGGEAQPTVMRIVTARGTPAVHLQSPTYGGQRELLLDRGLHYRIVADHGMKNGVRMVDVEAVPGQHLAASARLHDFAHRSCTLTACLNPLHPGPCKGWKGHPEEEFDKVARQAKKGIGAYNVPRGGKGTKAAHKAALLSYVNGSGPINRSLRYSKGGGSNHDQIVSEIKNMDRLMAESKLTRPITVMRAVSPSAFGGKDTNVDLTGAEYVDHAFGSTGTDLGKILQHFHTTTSGKKPLIATMVLPKGMSAVRAPVGKFGDEKEVLVDRGAHYRVVRDNGFIDTPKGRFRHVTIEVTPGIKPRAQKLDLGENNQTPRPASVQAAALCTFCLETHKPGLCAGQKRGDLEPGQVDQNTTPAVQKAQTAIAGLSRAIAQAHQIEAQNAANPKLAAQARRAVAGYTRALQRHQQTVRQAAQANVTNQRTAQRDVNDQNRLDAQAKKQADRQAEQQKLAKMTPRQRAAYRKAQKAKK